MFAAAFQCTPRVKIWEPWVDGYCINIFLVQLLVSIPSILCDIAILCLPLPHVLRLKTNLTQKIFLVIMFMLGSYVVFTSIYRFSVYLGYSPKDIPFTLAVPVAWNVIEISSGIVSSCLPTLVSCLILCISILVLTLYRIGTHYPSCHQVGHVLINGSVREQGQRAHGLRTKEWGRQPLRSGDHRRRRRS